jgi:hypothetical protein
MIALTKPKIQDVLALPSLGDTPPPEVFLKRGDKNLVCFLRHTGCPFAEELCRQVSDMAEANPQWNVVVIAHGSEAVARAWFKDIKLSASVTALVDPNREIYGRWGLGYCNVSELMNLKVLWRVAYLRVSGIRNRTASGTRWQRQAVFLVNEEGRLDWCHVAGNVSDVPVISIVPDRRA